MVFTANTKQIFSLHYLLFGVFHNCQILDLNSNVMVVLTN